MAQGIGQSHRTIVDLTQGIPPGLIKYRRFMSVDKVGFPDGRTGQWEAFYKPPGLQTVTVVALTRQGKMVLLSLFRFAPQEWSIELPGGDTQPNEDLGAAARRELLEETGYDTSRPLTQIADSFVSPGNMNVRNVFFYAPGCEKVREPRPDSMEEAAGLQVIEQDVSTMVRAITASDVRYSTAISHALVALAGKGIVSI